MSFAASAMPAKLHVVDGSATLNATIDAAINAAIAHLQAGRTVEARERLRALEVFSPDSHVRCNLIGLIHFSTGDNLKAVAWFDKALAVNSTSAEIMVNRGHALQKLDRLPEALASFDAAAKAGSTDPALSYSRGNILRTLGRLDEAILAYDMALRLKPAYPEALRAGGIVLRDLGRAEDALEFFGEALRLKPDFIDALLDRGNLLLGLSRFDEALATYDAALLHAPQHADILNNRSVALNLLGRFPEALAGFDEVVLRHPAHAQARFNRGNNLLRMGRPDAALESFDAALALRPDYTEALCSRAVALNHLGRMDEALVAFDTALARDPSFTHAKNNKAALLLLLGDFERGLDGYEFRWIAGQTPKNEMKLPIPEWSGRIVEGEKIVVFDEQGLGDLIQFARYLPLMAEAGAEVTFFCRKKMHRLMAGLEVPGSASPIRIVDNFDADEKFNSQIALSSLPHAFKTRLETIPARPAYLQAEESLVQQWAARLGTGGFKVGICWHGSPNIDADPLRSIRLAHFAPLAQIDGVRLISIQKVHGLSELDTLSGGLRIETLGDDFDAGPDAFIDTAAVMQSLDLVIACDTSVAHLAGALGRPVWVLLKKVPDWRWLLDRGDSPWYPSMRLFRQTERGDWNGVVARVAQALQALRSAASM